MAPLEQKIVDYLSSTADGDRGRVPDIQGHLSAFEPDAVTKAIARLHKQGAIAVHDNRFVVVARIA